MKKIVFDDHTIKKIPYDISDNIFLHNEQLYCIENIWNKDILYTNIIQKEIKKKLQSYKSQDKKSHKYDENKHISLIELVNKLKESKLSCYYCGEKIYLIYKEKRNPFQWSLERFDNNIGHYANNTCISCLKCNLQRRTSNHEYFKYSKNLLVTKSLS